MRTLTSTNNGLRYRAFGFPVFSTLAFLQFALTLLWVTDVKADQPTASKPNILFIYLDDFGWKDAHYMGSDFYETPNIDKLAAQSMVFTDAYAGAANCAPSRACLLSGQYSPRHKIFNVGTGPRGKSAYRRLNHVPGTDVLDPKLTTWAKLFQSNGYVTGTFGKWHLSKDPTEFGFDVNVGGSHSGSPPKGYYGPHPKAPGLETVPEGEYLTNRISAEADRFIRKNKGNPWLCYLTHFAVHTPIQPNKRLLAKYESKIAGVLHSNAKMATMIQSVDDGVGKLIATLSELGLDKETIVIFYSDNGGMGGITDMDPLKGYKGTYYEGGIRVPFFVNWPGVTDADDSVAKSNEPITAVDLYPTLANMAGLELPKQEFDGESIVPILKGESDTLGKGGEPRSIYWHFPAYLQSYRGDVSEQRDVLFRTRPCSVVRKGDWKLHQYFETGDIELYNLKDDIGETNDLSNSNREKTQSLLDDLKAWQDQISAPMPTRNNEYDPEKEALGIKQMKSKTK